MPESRLQKTRAAYPSPDGLIWIGSLSKREIWHPASEAFEPLSTTAVDQEIAKRSGTWTPIAVNGDDLRFPTTS